MKIFVSVCEKRVGGNVNVHEFSALSYLSHDIYAFRLCVDTEKCFPMPERKPLKPNNILASCSREQRGFLVGYVTPGARFQF